MTVSPTARLTAAELPDAEARYPHGRAGMPPVLQQQHRRPISSLSCISVLARWQRSADDVAPLLQMGVMAPSMSVSTHVPSRQQRPAACSPLQRSFDGIPPVPS